jgi:hypothetical protein
MLTFRIPQESQPLDWQFLYECKLVKVWGLYSTRVFIQERPMYLICLSQPFTHP